jgi:membrane protein DedA with SNARE-associated domain
MIESLIHFLQVSILPWGAMGVFVASVIEEVIAPIPSALIMTMSGFIFISGPISVSSISALIFKVAIPAALGVTIGSYFVYFVARYGGKLVIDKFGKYAGLYWKDIEKIQNRLTGTRRDEIVISGARILPIVPSVAISAFCGILQMNVTKYFFITFIGTFLRGIILGAIGWQVGSIYTKFAHLFDKIEDVVLISTILVVLIFIVIKYRGKRDVS